MRKHSEIKNAETCKNDRIKNAETRNNKNKENAERSSSGCFKGKFTVKCWSGKNSPVGKQLF